MSLLLTIDHARSFVVPCTWLAEIPIGATLTISQAMDGRWAVSAAVGGNAARWLTDRQATFGMWSAWPIDAVKFPTAQGALDAAFTESHIADRDVVRPGQGDLFGDAA